jgi:hypothetical protein
MRALQPAFPRKKMAEVIYRSRKKRQRVCIYTTKQGVKERLTTDRFPIGMLSFEDHVLKLDDRYDKAIIDNLDKDKRNKANGGHAFSKDEETQAAKNIQMMMAGKENVTKPAGEITKHIQNVLEKLCDIVDFEDIKDLKKTKSMLKEVFEYFTFEGINTNIQPLTGKRLLPRIEEVIEMLSEYKVWNDNREADTE